jgi:putative acetyltransferase
VTVIRPAVAADIEGVVAVFEPSFATLEFLPLLHTHEEHRAYFGRVIAADEVYVHEQEGIDGFAALARDVLSHLYVAPEAFGRGVALALFAEAKRQRPRGFTFWVFQQNERARSFYERLGCTAIRFTDGADNEERTPDVLYQWRPQ